MKVIVDAHKIEKSSSSVQDKHFLSFLNFCRLGHISSPEKETDCTPLINIGALFVYVPCWPTRDV
jgi:hypothetical protein